MKKEDNVNVIFLQIIENDKYLAYLCIQTPYLPTWYKLDIELTKRK